MIVFSIDGVLAVSYRLRDENLPKGMVVAKNVHLCIRFCYGILWYY